MARMMNGKGKKEGRRRWVCRRRRNFNLDWKDSETTIWNGCRGGGEIAITDDDDNLNIPIEIKSGIGFPMACQGNGGRRSRVRLRNLK